jgi:predicted cobalt transporter CbtA
LILGTHLLLPRGPLEQFIGWGLAATAAFQIAPDLGLSAQKYLTTAIPFNLEVSGISAKRDFWGRPAHFVKVHWRELQ